MPCHATRAFLLRPCQFVRLSASLGKAHRFRPRHSSARPKASQCPPALQSTARVGAKPWHPNTNELGHRIRLDHLNRVCYGRCGASAYRVSAAGGAQSNPTMTGFDFGDDLAELTLSELLPYKLLFRSRRAHCPPLQFELPYRSPLFVLQG